MHSRRALRTGAAVLAVVAVCLFFPLFPSLGAEPTEPARAVFRMRDPSGDDKGDGRIAYPLNEAFSPHKEILDLKAFSVDQSQRRVRFRFDMGRITNPWDAPEGFYHQRIDVFIHIPKADGGRETPLRPGPGVRFSSKYPWHLWLRIAPFDGTALYTWRDLPESPGRRKGIRVQADETTAQILVEVPRDLLSLDKGARYYVLVGSFDGFGPDGYRETSEEATEWLLRGAEKAPRVVDLLAPSWGPGRQKAQLRTVDQRAPVIQPVGGFDPFSIPPIWYGAGMLAPLAAFVFSARRSLLVRGLRRLFFLRDRFQ